ncbi:MAG: hydrogen gas-evolving membrane-bound hydrogenase subunit E [Candidatus Thermoplasmatota archaeon]
MRKIIGLIALLLCFGFFFFTAVKLHTFGIPKETAMDDYFNKNAQNETGTNNVVASIVFDYRGYDTLGEATVLFTAVTGVLALFRRFKS